MTVVLVVAHAVGAVAGLVVLGLAIWLLWSWLGAAADLLWAAFIRPRLVACSLAAAFAMGLLVTLPFLTTIVAGLFSAIATPLVAWAICNLVAWAVAAEGELVEPKTPKAFLRLRWRRAFADVAEHRQRARYEVPTVLLDDGALP